MDLLAPLEFRILGLESSTNIFQQRIRNPRSAQVACVCVGYKQLFYSFFNFNETE